MVAFAEDWMVGMGAIPKAHVERHQRLRLHWSPRSAVPWSRFVAVKLGGAGCQERNVWKIICSCIHMGVSENRGTPKLSILTGFSIINHPFWGTPIFGNTHIVAKIVSLGVLETDFASHGIIQSACIWPRNVWLHVKECINTQPQSGVWELPPGLHSLLSHI